MSQDNQNQNPQDDRQNPGADDATLETRGTGSSDSPQDQVGSSGPGSSPELEEDTDEMDDDDRDDDERGDGSPNRRHNIG